MWAMVLWEGCGDSGSYVKRVRALCGDGASLLGGCGDGVAILMTMVG